LYLLEAQIDFGRLKLMGEASALLDEQLRSLGRGVLNRGGRVSMVDARAHAEREYEIFKSKLAAERHAEADRTIAEIKATMKAVERG
jgi:hypothetical protein